MKTNEIYSSISFSESQLPLLGITQRGSYLLIGGISLRRQRDQQVTRISTNVYQDFSPVREFSNKPGIYSTGKALY